MKPCFCSFEATREAFSLVWVRLENIPSEFFHPKVLVKIGNALGSFMGIDEVTHNLAKTNFARFCVLLNLCKPLRSFLKIDGHTQSISFKEYIGFCFKCGKLGHFEASCPSTVAKASSRSKPPIDTPNT